jgi:hypothetical protein
MSDVLEEKAIVIVDDAENPETDFLPGWIMGAQACLGSLWWFASWFIYIKKDATFNLKIDIDGVGQTNTITLAWMFENLMSTQYGWISASLFTSFWLHMLTSLVELIAWAALWIFEDYTLFAWWSSTIGWWGSVAIGPLPVVFALLQIILDVKKGGFAYNTDQEVGAFTVWVLVMSAIVWLFNGIVHIIYINRLVAQATFGSTPDRCVCDAVTPLNPLASREDKEAYEALNVAICYTKCPIANPFCPLKKTKTETYDEYLAKCNELATRAKAAFDALPKEEAPSAVDASEEKDELL